MKVKDLMSTNIISVSPNDFASTALAKMQQNKVHQLVVMDGKKFIGVLELKKIVTKNIDPTKTKIDKLVSSSASISQNETIESAASLILDSGLRALPVMEKNSVVGVISETDLIKTISSKKYATDLATPCKFVSLEDNMGRVAEIMRDNNISRVPVVENGKLIGVVGTMDMVRFLEGKERNMKDKQSGTVEKMSFEEIKVKTIMSNPYVADSNTPLEKLKETLIKSEEVFVQDDVIKIITPKDILELLVQKPKRGAYVQITNLEEESSAVKSKVDKLTDEFVKKTADMTKDVEYLFIHIDRHQNQSKKIQYIIRTRFSTNIGLFVSHSSGWDLLTTMQDALDNLDREISKKYDISRSHDKERKSKAMRRMK